MFRVHILVLKNIFKGLLLAAALLLTPLTALASSNFLVLTYHDITRRDIASDDLSPEAFTRQIEYFRTNGWVFVSPQEILAAAKGAPDFPRKAILLTFDDAYESFYNRVFPVLQLLRVPAVLSAGDFLD